MQILDKTLLDLRDLLADEKNWTQGAFARDENGADLGYRGVNEGASWCLTGAILYVSPDDDTAQAVWRKLREKIGSSLDIFNDSVRHADILALLDWSVSQT